MPRHSNNSPKGFSCRPGHNSRFGLGFSLALILGLGTILLSFNSCSPKPPEESIVAFIDEAFAGLFPDAAHTLAIKPGLIQLPKSNSDNGEIAKSGKVKTRFLALGSLKDSTISLLQGWEQGTQKPKVLIASPLAAIELVRVQKTPGTLPVLVVPFAISLGLSNPIGWSLEYDYLDAYSTLGKKVAKALQPSAMTSSEKRGGYCLVLFEANMLRGRKALDAFAESFGRIAGDDRLKLEILSPYSSSADRAGAFEQALATHMNSATLQPTVIVFATDNPVGVEDAIKKAVLSKKDDSGKAPTFFADCGSWGKSRADKGLFAWRIEADEIKLAEAGLKAARNLVKAGLKEPDEGLTGLSLVPLRIISQGKK